MNLKEVLKRPEFEGLTSEQKVALLNEPVVTLWQSLGGKGEVAVKDVDDVQTLPAEYPHKSVLVGINVQPLEEGRRVMLSCRVTPVAIVKGTAVADDSAIVSFDTADAENTGKLSEAQAAFSVAVLAALDEFLGTL